MGPRRSSISAPEPLVFDRRTLLRGIAGTMAAVGAGPALWDAAGAQGASPSPLEAPAAAEVLWDTWGVPHIFSGDAPGLFSGFGWAQAHAHGNVLLRLYAEARGRSAELFGRDALVLDRLIRTMGLPARGDTWFAAQPDTFRANIDAFAAGINAYAARYPERLTAPGAEALPVTGPDVMAHAARICFDFVAGESEVLDVMLGGRRRGSNGWAVGPSHAAAGNAMLLANPHVPWSGEYLWFEAQLTAPGVYDAYGATLVGLPVLAIAFNDTLGWTHTVNTLDGADAYRLTPDGAVATCSMVSAARSRPPPKPSTSGKPAEPCKRSS